MKRSPRQQPALLALLCVLALITGSCRREVSEERPAQPTETRVAETPVPAAPQPAPAPTPIPQPPSVAAPDRHDVEQPPRAVVPAIPPPVSPPPQAVAPPPSARERSLEERERRLARRQAQLKEREERLRRQEAEAQNTPAPALEPEPAPAEPAPVPEPAPEPPAPPTPPAPVTVPAGTQLDIQLSRALSSKTNKAGDTFRAQIQQALYDGDQLVIPAGAEIVGEVTQAEPLRKKFGGKAVLSLRFTDLVLPSGETVPIHASLRQEGENKGKSDAAAIGGATAGGAILGHILGGGGGKGTLIGAILGAAAGAVIAARHPGEEVVIPEGTVLGIVFDQPAEVHRRR